MNKECKDAAIKIQKGEFRYAIQVTIKDHQSWQYRHWYAHTTGLVFIC
jgi:hypothetical protein